MFAPIGHRYSLYKLHATLKYPSMFSSFFNSWFSNTTESETLRQVVGNINDLADGEMKEVSLSVPVKGQEEPRSFKMLLSRIEGKYHATGHLCPHYKARLVTGVLDSQGRVTCPWHVACFKVQTGDIEEAPSTLSLKSYPITADKDGSLVASFTLNGTFHLFPT